jgi:xanthine/CO dehydrogenase XdhC/CoxF family maturation factor
MGLEIGALSPEEIAISITAELVAVRRNTQGAQHKKLQRERREAIASGARAQR